MVNKRDEEMKKVKILFVCLGNICRSPAAEGVFLEMLRKRGLQERFEIDSAGTYGGHAGNLPDKRMREAARARGYVLVHRSRKFSTDDFDRFDMIVVMDDNNYYDVRELAPSPEAVEKIWRMTDFNDRFEIDHVPDPYYGGEDGFEFVMDLLEESSANLLDKLLSEDLGS